MPVTIIVTTRAIRRRALLALVPLIALAALAIPGRAVLADTGLTIQPVKASYTLKPGQSVTDTILIKNPGGDAMVYPSVQDFVPLRGSSNIQFVGRAPGVTSVADWIKIKAPSEFGFAAGEERSITYTVTAPADAEPGSHFGGIFFRAMDERSAKSQLKIGTQVGMLVLVTIPGNHLQKGQVDLFKADGFVQRGPVEFFITFENTGTVYFEPKGEIAITNMFGNRVATVPVEGQVVLPTGARDMVVTWPAGFLLGPYTAALTLYDGDHNPISGGSVKIFALPLWYIAGIIALFVILYVLIVFLKNRVSFTIALKK